MNADAADERRVLYCAGCNERFRNAGDANTCPRCGAECDEVPERAFAETVHIAGFTPGDDVDLDLHLSSDEVGRTLDDKFIGGNLHVYEVESLLGAGGMGRVYLAQHADLRRRCALKVLSPRAEQDIDFVERFLQEGQAAAALVHPNIVTVHAIGKDGPHHFLEMEFVAGRTLQQVIDTEGRLTPLRATSLTMHVATGLAAAHRADIIHRDLKPDNVLLTDDGIPKIADFGLAKRILINDDLPTESLAGTPNFMAPELYQGADATAASDVFALGVSYYLLLTGELPFVAGTLNELMRLICHEPVPNFREQHPDIPLEMAECVHLLLEKSPRNRPQNAVEAAQLLHAVWGQIPDLESLLTGAFRDEAGVSWTRQGSRYELRLCLPDGRKQTVLVENSQHGAAQRLLLIYSLCCPAQPEFYEDALRLNAEMSHGGIALREIDGELSFCVVDTYPRGTVDAEEVRRSVLEVAYRADAVEDLLTGLDEH